MKRLVYGGAVLLLGVVGYRVGLARANGIPQTGTMAYTGTLLQFGQPVTSGSTTYSLGLALYVTGQEASGTPLCSTTPAATTVTDGSFTIALPDSCVAQIHGNPNVDVVVTVNGTAMAPAPLTAVPYAVEADTASNAASGSALATSLSTLQTNVGALQTQGPVAASYKGSTTTVPSSGATIVYTDELVDTNSAYSNGVYTVPVSGTYQVDAQMSFLNESGVEIRRIQILHDSSVVTMGIEDAITGGGGTIAVHASALFQASAGDTISVVGWLTATATLDDTEANYLNIHLIR